MELGLCLPFVNANPPLLLVLAAAEIDILHFLLTCQEFSQSQVVGAPYEVRDGL